MVDINDKATDHSAFNEVEALRKRVKEYEAQLLKTENDGLETRFFRHVRTSSRNTSRHLAIKTMDGSNITEKRLPLQPCQGLTGERRLEDPPDSGKNQTQMVNLYQK